jgi:hypothetical protein
MARVHSYFSSPRRLFHPSSRSVDHDVADSEESFRNSSFALVPSALTPSRAPSNSVITAKRALFFNRPVPLDFPSGWEKGPVIDWYNKQGAKGSTTIEKILLRRNYQHPYYHEYIIVSTRSGHTYRIDRRPDPDAPFDTIMKTGCTAYDTIQEVDSTSLKELDSTSSCVVELHWQSKSEQSIDLLFVLSICFAIRNDEWADRYTLQRYNCYFLSWTIIAITMRKSAVRRPAFNAGRVLERELVRELELELVRVRVRVRERVRVLLREPVPVPEQVLMQALALMLDLERELARGLARELELELTGELVRELTRELAGEPGWELARELAEKMTQELKRQKAPERALAWQWAQEWAQDLGRKMRQTTRETARKSAREWAHGLGQIPLGLRKHSALAKAVSPRQVDFVILLLWGLIDSNVARRALGRVTS